MNIVRIAGATINQTPLDFAGNAARIKELISEARRQGVELLCLPELCITGYGCEDAFFGLNTARQAEATLVQLLPETYGLTVVVGLPVFYSGAMYNCAAVVQDGKVLGLNAKKVLSREGVHYEPRWFKPWPFERVVHTELCGSEAAMGDVRYRLGFLGVAIEICEEAWDSVPAAHGHADAVDIILNPSASHFALGKYAKREHLVANSSRSMQVIYVYANLVGNEAGRLIYDGGVLIAQNGEIIARGPRFGFSDGRVTAVDVYPDLAKLAKLRGKPVRGEERAEWSIGQRAGFSSVEIKGQDPIRLFAARCAAAVVKRPVGASSLTMNPSSEVSRDISGCGLSREEEFLHAQMLGLFDYMRKARAQGIVVSLSGGCDSSTVAILVAHMLASALRELGPEPMAQRLGMKGPASQKAADWVRRCLVAVYQGTRNSGSITRDAASAVAAEIGAEFHSVDVDPIVELYVKAAEAISARPLAWARDDTALQNIQARTRAPLIWLLANLRGFLLLTTSNRSEAAVGYATMDGDTAGGLAPLAGIDKPFLRHFLRWAQTSCPKDIGLGPLASLQRVNDQAPTAELRPPGSLQTDEGDLMPYPVLERIERYFVRDRLGPQEILQMLSYDFPSLATGALQGYLTKFLHLWSANQWKRERYAPSFHLDDESLDPKTWCRFPILSVPPSL